MCSVRNLCNLHNLKIAVYAREGVWVVGGQMQVRVSVQQVVTEFPGKSEEQEGRRQVFSIPPLCNNNLRALHLCPEQVMTKVHSAV